MPRLRLPKALIEELTNAIAEYISEQRDSYRPKARTLTLKEREPIQAFFPSDVLTQVRVFRGCPQEPSFYPRLRNLGIHNAPPFSEMGAITFQDLILHVEPLSRSLLFHELVHVVQYKHLGLKGFSQKYVMGFLAGGSYEEIPLERNAYDLEATFSSKPEATFSVEQDVKERSAKNGF
jgi:hypothetical protein